jgi:AmmeMemoRadiSam system protein A
MSSPDRATAAASERPNVADEAVPSVEVAIAEGHSLRHLARTCIDHALAKGLRPRIDLAAAPASWLEPAACFVTLEIRGALRGCCGSFDATQPLALGVAANAHRSAFEDPRFPAVTRTELPGIEIEVSVLGPFQPLAAASRQALLAQLEPGVDGLVLSDARHHATFLPDVWSSLPDPDDFFDALLQKAGLPRGYWSPTLRFERYETTKAD